MVPAGIQERAHANAPQPDEQLLFRTADELREVAMCFQNAS
jgi:hypothetical protein